MNKNYIVLLAKFSLIIGVINLIVLFGLKEYSNIRFFSHYFSLGFLTGIILFVIALKGGQQQ